MDYPKIEHYGSRNVRGIDDVAADVIVQEKLDGSQISFARELSTGRLRVWSKNRELDLANPDKMFAPAVESLQARADMIEPGYKFRGEYLSRPKHNVLAYERTPRGLIAVFDVDAVTPMRPEGARELAQLADLEYVEPWCCELLRPLALPDYQPLSDAPSMLGGIREGVVIKNYNKKLYAKIVRDQFKELRTGRPVIRPEAPAKAIGHFYATPGRWQKAVQHLRESGRLLGSMADMRALINEIRADVRAEHEQDIRDALWEAFEGEVMEATHLGLADWYRQQLAAKEGEP